MPTWFRPGSIQMAVHCDITRVDTRADFVSALGDRRFDLILADYSLPTFDGMSALKMALEYCPDVPYIFVSGKMGEDIAVESLKSGATDYVLKDKLSRLAPAIRRALKEAEDRAERKWAEGKINDLNRVYAVLSSVNQLIIRETDQQSLFENICRIAVDKGRFVMAWVGLLDEDTQTVRPVAYTGCEEGYLKNIRISVGDVPEGEGPTGTSIRKGLHEINNDTANNPDMLPWRAEALKRGYLSSASFPLMRDGKSIGAIVVYSQKPGFFSEDEVLLLDEMAADISFALKSIEQEKLKKRAEEALQESEEKYRTIFEESFDGLFITSPRGNILDMNKKGVKMFGYDTKEEIFAVDLARDIYADPQDRQRILSMVNAQGSAEYEIVLKKKNGDKFIASASLTAVKDAKGIITSYRGIVRDITDRKEAAEALKSSEERFRLVFENSPVSIWEEDFSAVKNIFDDLRDQGVGDIEAYLQQHPEVVRRCAELAKVINVNRAALSMHEASSKEELLRGLPNTFTPESFFAFQSELISLWKGETDMVNDAVVKTMSGLLRNVTVYCSVKPGCEQTLSSVLVSIVDITERKRSEDALRNEAAITGALLEAANVASRNLVWEEVAGNVAGLVHELTASKSVFIFLLSSDDILLPQCSVGLTGDGLKQFYDLNAPVEDIICFKDALTSKSTMVLKSDELECFGLADFTDALMLRELVLTPIITRDKTVGFLCVNFDRIPPDHRVLAIIEGIARQLGVAHDSGRLYQETQNKSIELARSLETLKVLYDIDTKVLSTLDREEVLTAAVSQLRRVVPADIACVLLLDEDNSSLRFHYGWCMGSKKGDLMTLEQCTGAATLKTGMTMVRNNLAGEACLSDFDKALFDGGIRSDLFVPIICKGNGVGLLQVGSFRVAGYTREDITTIERLSCQIGIALENARLLSDVEEMFINVVTALSSAIDAKSPWTKGHSERVTNFALMIADQMGLSQEEKDKLKLAGLLHDIGKIGTYDVILDKPDKLTDEEFELVKKHPDAGADILQPIKQFKDIIPLIRYHHERWDGKGYPAGLSGSDIPLLARILCIADSCDSMTADRPYRPAPGYEFAVAEFRRCGGTQFDPEIVEAFLDVIDERLAA